MIALFRSSSTAALFAAAVFASTPGLALAQQTTSTKASGASSPTGRPQDGTTQLGEIIVTAQKRSERLQSVPASISAVGAEQIARRNVENVGDLQRVSPSVTITSYFNIPQINIRGLGYEASNATGDPNVLLYIDGVNLVRPTATATAFEDLQRIEVLRGPQGTLYGRNATGGVVNLITRTPGDSFGANLSTTYGSYDRLKVAGGIEGPIAPGVSNRLSFFHDSNSGDQINLVTDQHVRDLQANGARDTLVAHLGPDFTATLRGDYYRDRVNGSGYDLIANAPTTNGFASTPGNPGGIFGPLPGFPPSRPLPNDGRHIAYNSPNQVKHTNYGTSVTLDWQIAPSMSLKSITAYRASNYWYQQDADGSDADILSFDGMKEYSRAFTQEIDLAGKTDGGANWVAGIFYMHEHLDLDYHLTFPVLAELIDIASGLPPGTVSPAYTEQAAGNTSSISAFAQVTVPITERLKLTAGARENYDSKKLEQSAIIFGSPGCQAANSAGHWKDLTYRLGLDYQLTQHNLLYANVATGFKAGGLNLGNCNSSFLPEKITSWEVGSKNTFLDGSLLFNLSAFYYDYTDLRSLIG